MNAILKVENLSCGFEVEKEKLYAVRGVSFSIFEGSTFALVGESGCGKTITSLAVMGLLPKPGGFTEGGEVLFKEKDLLSLPEEEMRGLRGKEIGMIFQEPMTSLNPVFTVGYQIAEVYSAHGECSLKEGKERAVEMLRKVKIPDPENGCWIIHTS